MRARFGELVAALANMAQAALAALCAPGEAADEPP
jgi:hypothetical protein